MSFSSEQKSFIINSQYKPCCRKNLLSGVLYAKAKQDDEITVSLEKKPTAEFVSKLIKEFYGEESVIKTSESGGRRYSLHFTSKSALKYLSGLSDFDKIIYEKCDQCRTAFLRGVFLASGRLSDPSVQYSLEFSLADRCESFVDMLQTIGVCAMISSKKNDRVVYIKSCDAIEEFCAYSGLNRAMFTLFDAKAKGELRKNAMRVANCETNNIAKTVDAARSQLEIINALNEANLLSSLPEELEATARLRLEYSDYSLAQLSAMAVPPISKPGLSHRLKKIMELGARLLEHKNNQ